MKKNKSLNDELQSVIEEKTLSELMTIVRSCTNKEEAEEKISKEFGISKENAGKIIAVQW